MYLEEMGFESRLEGINGWQSEDFQGERVPQSCGCMPVGLLFRP